MRYTIIEESEVDSGELTNLNGSFFSRNKTTSKSIKKRRMEVEKKKVNRPIPPMTTSQYNCLKTLYRKGSFFTFNRRTLFKDQLDLDEEIDKIKEQSTIPDRKTFMSLATEIIGKTKADSAYREITNTNQSDSEMVSFINEIEECFERDCHYKNDKYVVTGEITRGGVCAKELVSLTFISKVGIDMFKNNVHILYVDACFTSDKGNIFLAVFLDGNHMVQPIGFQICSIENHSNWIRFMRALRDAGIRDDDLVINSDRHQSIAYAVSDVFPQAEHSSCFVHVERNIQSEWDKLYGSLRYASDETVETFNSIIHYLNRARMATNKSECDVFLARIRNLEKNHSKCEATPLYDYIKNIEGIYMHTWKHEHLLQVTSNPVEVCMKDIKEPRYGLKGCRSETVLNKYRYLIHWIYDRMEVRYKSLQLDSRIPVSLSSRIPTPFVEHYVRSLGHYYEYYRNHFLLEDPLKTRAITTPLIRKVNVTDEDYHLTYTVDLIKKSCTCNTPHWSKLPCIHVIAVLHERNEFKEVWDYVGEMYMMNEVKKTSSRMTYEEKELMNRIVERNMIPLNIENTIDVNLVNNRGRHANNSRRIRSVGE